MTLRATATSQPTKALFHISINWYGENLHTARHAYSNTHAWYLAKRVFAMRLGVSPEAIEHHTQRGDKRKIRREQ